MAGIFSYVSALFEWLFVGTTGTNATPAALATVIDLITGNAYLMVGLSLMIAGSAIGFLSRLIKNG